MCTNRSTAGHPRRVPRQGQTKKKKKLFFLNFFGHKSIFLGLGGARRRGNNALADRRLRALSLAERGVKKAHMNILLAVQTDLKEKRVKARRGFCLFLFFFCKKKNANRLGVALFCCGPPLLRIGANTVTVPTKKKERKKEKQIEKKHSMGGGGDQPRATLR